MSSLAVVASGIGKKYRVDTQGDRAAYGTLRESLVGALRLPRRRRSASPSNEFWALRDVSFCVRQGEVLGIIGRNGAGKSTLLKILSRITEPTVGRARVRGRVGSLLEVGTGFHPELTGRENVFLNGAILGMSRADVRRRFDEIVTFAEIERFVDVPVKRYSSGMYMRLAFSVAAHLEPDVLIVDEVLAVGDIAFQRKCLGQMRSYAKGGRTVLFVSHNMPAVSQFSNTVMLLEAGRVTVQGTPDSVIRTYLAQAASRALERRWNDLTTAPGDERARLRAIRVLTAEGRPATSVTVDESFILEVEYDILKPGAVVTVSLSLFTQEGIHVIAAAPDPTADDALNTRGLGSYRSRCVVPGNLLNSSVYFVSVLLVVNRTRVVAQVEQAVTVEIGDSPAHRGGYFGSWPGVIRVPLSWQTMQTAGARHLPSIGALSASE